MHETTVTEFPVRISSFVKYLAASGVALAADFAAYVALVSLARCPIPLAAAAGFILGSLIVWTISRVFVFEGKRIQSVAGEFGVFFLVGCLGLVVNEVVVIMATGVFEMDYRMAKLVAAGATFLFNYFWRSRLVFRTRIDATV